MIHRDEKLESLWLKIDEGDVDEFAAIGSERQPVKTGSFVIIAVLDV